MCGAQDHYNFHLIFRGLFRCVPDRENGRLSVLLVDARSPKKSQVTCEPLRDHRAVIEFRLKDWRNRTLEPLPNFVEVNKRTKGEVGIYLLDRQDIRIGPLNGKLFPELIFMEEPDSPTSFLRLPRLSEIEPGAEVVLAGALQHGQNCVARVLELGWGEVRSERSSTDGNRAPVRWAFSRPRRRANRGPDPRDLQLPQEIAAATEINLDLRVTMQVSEGASVLIDANPFPSNGLALDPREFVLRPDPGEDLEVWIKNRELEVVLTESDRLDQEDGCLANQDADFDFELHYELSASPQARRIPYIPTFFAKNPPVTAGGCACGGICP